MPTRILVAMSGGVDSSVAALLLKRQGYEVGGATFELFDGCDGQNVEDAQAVCELLGIPHHLLDYRALFSERVLGPFCGEYLAGRTPNPCVACNRAVKFGAFARDAARLGYEKISTGHYAGVRFDETTGRWQLWRSAQEKKDQSYVLYHLSQRQLSMLELPLDRLAKEEVRALAREAGLPVFSKSDSQDICFVPDGDYVSFIERHTGKRPEAGDFVDEAGNPLGRHGGYWRYTIGQRRGLGVALGRRMTVSRLDPAANRVTLSDEAAVLSDTLFAEDLRLIACDALAEPVEVEAKIRYAHRPAPATVYPLGNGEVRVKFAGPQRAITAGQAVVFYEGDRVLGGATIR